MNQAAPWVRCGQRRRGVPGASSRDHAVCQQIPGLVANENFSNRPHSTLVNSPNETKYYYQDLDERGARLNGASRYTVTFPKDQTPPVHGFWSLTLYNEHHFFAPNPLKRYSLGTKNKALKLDPDGSLTLYVQADSPGADKESNWLPAPKDADFSLYVRAYWPKVAVTDGSWTPPPVRVAS